MKRKVRTVPPSAIFDPPTPTEVEASSLTTPAAGPSTTPAAQHRRPRPRLRYSSDSSCDTDHEDDESDEDPPWWTFTQRGMARLRTKNLHRGGRDVEQGAATEGESGREREGNPKERNRMSGVFLPHSRRGSRDKDGVLSSRRSSKDKSAVRRGARENEGASSSRRGSRDKDRMSSKPSSVRNLKRQSGDQSSSQNASSIQIGRMLQPAPIRFPSSQPFFRLSPFHRDSVAGTDQLEERKAMPIPPPMKRTSSAPTRPASAPTSPTMEEPSPGMTTLVDHGSRFSSQEDPAPGLSNDGAPARRQARRQLTSPNFPRFFRRNEGDDEPVETMTDSEVVRNARDQAKRRYLLSKPIAIPGSSDMEAQDSNHSTPEVAGASTPSNRPKNRRKGTSHMLRINLPPPLSQHFAGGWPHAGTWQDALYGYYDEDSDANMAKSRSRKSTRNDSNALPPIPATVSETAAEGGPVTPQRPEFAITGPDGVEHTPTAVASDRLRERDPSRRQKSRRQKRYRPALVPPTPSGLGFTPSRMRAEEETEYPWTEKSTTIDENAVTNDNGHGATYKEQNESQQRVNVNGGHAEDLSRYDTNATQTGTHTTATDSLRGNGRRGLTGWWTGRQQAKEAQKRRRRPVDNSDWRRRYRRMLFLDARVTIWIRLVNLAVVVVLLGLAVTIRLELHSLRVPGLIGSSTTLIIAYSSLTILHVLTAIYREYFGKPIGLWGLRSKMLWVCLDLLFVALWSSAMSLSINDLIGTPLQCTATKAWWRQGLASDYASLLDELKLLEGNLTTSTADAVSHISHSLTITLPDSVISSALAKEACRRQAGCIALSLLALLLYGGNMVLSLFRIFETVRRTANVSKAVTF
ncbi:hypothetical protein IAU60_002707 [Kwoniella sp. DSM 27419]